MRIYLKNVTHNIVSDDGSKYTRLDYRGDGRLHELKIEDLVKEIVDNNSKSVLITGLSFATNSRHFINLVMQLTTLKLELEVVTVLNINDFEYFLGTGVETDMMIALNADAFTMTEVTHIGKSVLDSLSVNGVRIICESDSESPKLYIVTNELEVSDAEEV